MIFELFAELSSIRRENRALWKEKQVGLKGSRRIIGKKEVLDTVLKKRTCPLFKSCSNNIFWVV
jgi:hypothetical protein